MTLRNTAIPTNCCTRCFQAKEIIAIIEADGVEAKCDFCGSEKVKTVPAEDLREHFEPLMELYEEADEQKFHEEESLADLIADWNVFSDKLAIEKRNEILDEIRLGQKSPKELSIFRNSSERWQIKDAYWEEYVWGQFADYIKGRRRFIMGKEFNTYFSEPRDWLEEILSASEMTIKTTKTFFRAREGCSKKHFEVKPFPSEEMGPPPSGKARRGRANPAGISYLYVAEETETAVAEIRPYVGAHVSICSIKANKELKVADITKIHKIESAFGQPHLKTQVRRNALLDILNRELARPVNPDDSEIEYVPTQYLAEAIFDLGYNGIRYRSAVRKGGTNFVFFEPSDLTIEPNTRLVIVESIDVKYT